MSDKRVSRSYPFSSYYSGPDEDEQESATEADSSPTPLPISDSDVIGSGQECEEVQESAIEGPSSSIPDSDDEDDEDDAESGDVVSRLLRDYFSYLLNHPQPTSRMNLPSLSSLCGNYGYSTDMSGMSGFYSNNFFQDYASRNGYTLTDHFLSSINALRDMFVGRVRGALSTNEFSKFLFKINASNREDLLSLLNSDCCSFSVAVYRIRTSLVFHLKSEILPLVLDAVNDLDILDETGKSTITFADRECLFLHIITALERSIMLSVMNHWNNFCDLNEALFSSFEVTDYRDPFVRATSTGRLYSFDIPTVVCPVAFTYRNGVYISIFAAKNIDLMTGECSSDCIPRLKDFVTKKITAICAASNYDSVSALSRHVGGKLYGIVIRGFRKIIVADWIKRLVTYFRELTVWSDLKLDESVFFKIFEVFIHSVLISMTANITKSSPFVRNAIREYVDTMKSKEGKNRYSALGLYKFDVDEEVFNKVMKVRSDNLVAFKEKATEKFIAIIRERGVASGWDIELFKIALEAAKDVVDKMRDELKKIISEVKVIINDKGVKRKIKYKEKVDLHKSIMQTSNKRLRDVARELWISLNKGDLSSIRVTSVVVCTSETAAGGGTSETSTEVSAAGTSVVATTSRSSAGGSSSVRLPLNLVEEDMLEFNSIMEEFSTSFEPVICEVIGSMLEEIDIHSCSFDYILSKIAPVVSERRYRFFTEGGFSARALSLLPRSRVMTADGSRITTDAERAKILNLSMTIIAKGIDNFVGSYVNALLSSVVPVSRSKPSQLVEGAEEEGKGKSKAKGEKRRREEEYSDGVPAKFGSMLVHSEFNEDLDSMISEHIGSLSEVVRSIRVDLETGYPHLTVEVRRNAMHEQSRAASERLLSEFMYRVKAVIGTIFVYDRDSGEPRAINDREIGYFMNGLHAEMIVKHSEVLSKELPKKC